MSRHGTAGPAAAKLSEQGSGSERDGSSGRQRAGVRDAERDVFFAKVVVTLLVVVRAEQGRARSDGQRSRRHGHGGSHHGRRFPVRQVPFFPPRRK